MTGPTLAPRRLLALVAALAAALLTLTVGSRLGVRTALAQSAPSASAPANSRSGVGAPSAAPSASQGQSQLLSILSSKQLALEQQLEERVRRLIPGEGGQYLLVVKVVLDRARILAEYAPRATEEAGKPAVRSRVLPMGDARTEEREAARELTSDILFGFVTRINVSLTLDATLSAEQVAGIRQAIEQALQITAGRGTVSIKQANMSSGTMRRAVEEEKAKNEIEKTKLQQEISSLSDELRRLRLEATSSSNKSTSIDDAKLTRMLTEIDSLKSTLAGIDKRAAPARDFSGPLGPVKKVLEGLELPVALVAVALVVVVFVALFGALYVRAQSRTSSNLAAGLSALAGAVNKIATNQSQGYGGAGGALGNGGPRGEIVDAQGNTQRLPEAGLASPALLGGEASQSLELAAKEAAATLELLKKVPYPMLSALKDWLMEPDGMLRFLAFSEAVGVENSRALWAKFPREELERLAPYLYRPVPKIQAYATVVQLYRYVMKELTTKPVWFTQLDLDFLVGLTDVELAELLDSLELETAACGLLFVSSARAGRILKALKETPREDIVGTMMDMTGIAPDEARKHAEILKREKPNTLRVNAFDISDTLVGLLEGGDAEARSAALRVLEEDPDLETRVKARVFTFDDALRVDDDTLLELLSVFETESIAALVSGLAPPQQARIASLYNGKVKFAISEELQRIGSKPSLQRKARAESAALQATLARRVKALVDAGQVTLRQEERRDVS